MSINLEPEYIAKTIFLRQSHHWWKVAHKLNTWVYSWVSWLVKLANKLLTHIWRSPGKVTYQLTYDLPANLPTNPLPTSYPRMEVSSPSSAMWPGTWQMPPGCQSVSVPIVATVPIGVSVVDICQTFWSERRVADLTTSESRGSRDELGHREIPATPFLTRLCIYLVLWSSFLFFRRYRIDGEQMRYE